MEMALNSFAPGHEIVKDKKIYRAVGVVDYEYNQQHIVSVKVAVSISIPNHSFAVTNVVIRPCP